MCAPQTDSTSLESRDNMSPGKGEQFMRQSRLFVYGIAAAFAIALAGCSSNKSAETQDSGVPGDAGEDGGFVATSDGGPGSQCLPDGTACSATSGGVCCSGICDPATSTCNATGTFCAGPGEACGNNTDCCTNHCVGGTCTNTQCLDVNATCTSAAQCCTGLCNANGKCDPLPGATCGIVGQACTSGAGCCSNNCQGGVCVRAYFCQADHDICYGNDDCCGHLCSKNDGTPGVCQVVAGGGGGTCTQAGNPCLNVNSCCSRVCADPGTGVEICQPATGCALTGAFCNTAQDCCGGGTNPNGSVQCNDHRCDNGTSCNPVGNTCGARVLPDGGAIPESQNCCDGKKVVCKEDSSGIPRCFGGCPSGNCTGPCPNGYDGTPGCCIQKDDVCQFKDQCCDGAPCVPGSDGKLHCTTAQCIPLGSACTPGGDGGTACCAGDCLPSGGELGGTVCRIPSSQGGGDAGTGTDAGSGAPDAGACIPNGNACTSATMCCSGQCVNGVCGVPSACQPQGAVCTASADCCSGLNCVFPAGSTTGTCEPSTCAGSGQSCSSSSPCCNGLSCKKADGTACDDTSCTCKVVIN
jgi:hypothetical protein